MSTYASNVPGAAGYTGAAALAQKAYENAMARYQRQRSDTLLKYGVHKNAAGGYDADANNEYGQFQQMWKGEDAQNEHLSRAQAASGWGADSGYLGAARDSLSYAQGAEQAATAQGLQGDLSDVAQGEQGAAFDRDSALYTAEEQAARDAINRQEFNPADYGGINDEVPYGEPKAAAPPAKKAAPTKPRPSVHAKGKAKIMKRKAKGRRR